MPNVDLSAAQRTPARTSDDETAPAEPPQRRPKRARAAADTDPSSPRVTAAAARTFSSPEQFVQRALRLTAAPKDGLVAVAGPDGLAAMVSLCRAGYGRVECARQATCAGADEACDLLLLVGPMDAQTLIQTVRRTARLLADGGALVAEIQTPGDEACIRPALAAEGLRTTFSLADRPASRLVLHVVQRAALARRAG